MQVYYWGGAGLSEGMGGVPAHGTGAFGLQPWHDTGGVEIMGARDTEDLLGDYIVLAADGTPRLIAEHLHGHLSLL